MYTFIIVETQRLRRRGKCLTGCTNWVGQAATRRRPIRFRAFDCSVLFSLSLSLSLFLVSLFLLRSRYEETSTGTANTDRTEFGWSRAGTMPRKSWNAGYNFVSGQRRVHYTEHRVCRIVSLPSYVEFLSCGHV